MGAMQYRSLLPLLSLSLSSFAFAEGIIVEPSVFVVEKTFQAVALPEQEAQLLQLKAEKWGDFKIEKVLAHGAAVKKGDVLVQFDREGYDQKLADARRAVKATELSLAQAEQDLAWLEKTTANKLEALKRAATIAKEENDYFVKIRRANSEKAVDQALKRKQEGLENEKEELRQLEKMYKADDLTEETEEIILTRQKAMVEAATVGLELEQENHKRAKQVLLPREAIGLAEAERDSAIALARGEKDLPRALELKKIEVEGLKVSRERELKNLTELEKDQGCFELKANEDGVFYYGAIENGRWSANPEFAKSMVVDGKLPVQKVFASVIPAKSKLGLVAFLDEASARVLKKEASGVAVLTGREDVEAEAKIKGLASVPAADGTYRADVSVNWTPEVAVVTGATSKVTVQAYCNEKALVLPAKALTRVGKDWVVQVKLTDGKSEQRKVKRGQSQGDRVEIVSGLEPGQVVLLP